MASGIRTSLPSWPVASCGAKLPQLRQALNGRVQPHHVVLISQLLAHVDFPE
jgi:hypothetical protein